MKRGLKLYVWEGVLWDYVSGIMFALAKNVDEARQLLIAQSGNSPSVQNAVKLEPQEYTDKMAIHLFGGGCNG